MIANKSITTVVRKKSALQRLLLSAEVDNKTKGVWIWNRKNPICNVTYFTDRASGKLCVDVTVYHKGYVSFSVSRD